MEYYLISCCAPTLAGKKIANLFTFKHAEGDRIHTKVNVWNERLNPFGVFIKILRTSQSSSLILVYRMEKVKTILQDENIMNFLHSKGYESNNLQDVLKRIRFLLNKSSDFPHEIGLLLGYPLHDVIGFIKNNGRCSKLSGFWKVYGDHKEAGELFKEYNHCRNCFMNLYNQGMTALEIMEKYNGGYVQ
ncbi:MAG: DUF3793 family protein [Tissierellia bacterium]|nr:DUF3793 family protein [Tissierellia bacterium]